MEAPLSWDEARSILRGLLNDHLDHSSHKRDDLGRGQYVLSSYHESLLSKCISRDLDLYAGALVLTIIILVLSSLSLHDRLNTKIDSSLVHPKATLSLYYTELAGAIILVLASLTNTWVVRRRRFLCWNDQENAKRREILKFLRDASNDEIDIDKVRVSQSTNGTKTNSSTDSLAYVQLTAQTEVYPVFRKRGNLASWSSIPSLLLVKGDWIALQIGDIAPANCATTSKTKKTIRIAAGERLTVEMFGCTSESTTANLPQGRATLSSHSSDHFLTLCNNMRVYSVEDSPVLASLNRSSGTFLPSVGTKLI
jgi:hypothetical protein